MTTPSRSLVQVCQRLNAIKRELHASNGIEVYGIVGSVARGTNGPSSDVDVAARVAGSAGMFELSHLTRHLEAELGRPVDLVFPDALAAERRAFLLRDFAGL